MLLLCPGVLGLLLLPSLSLWGVQSQGWGSSPPRNAGAVVCRFTPGCCSPVPPRWGLLGCVMGSAQDRQLFPGVLHPWGRGLSLPRSPVLLWGLQEHREPWQELSPRKER